MLNMVMMTIIFSDNKIDSDIPDTLSSYFSNFVNQRNV